MTMRHIESMEGLGQFADDLDPEKARLARTIINNAKEWTEKFEDISLPSEQRRTLEPVLKVEDLILDAKSIKVKRGGKEIKLTPHEFRLLEYLMRNGGNVLSKDKILDRIWDTTLDVEIGVVRVCISNLRKKVDNGFDNKLIHAVYGFGYKIMDPSQPKSV